MCGIAGYIKRPNDSLNLSVLSAMGKSLTHRGPDDHGFLVWDGNSDPVCQHDMPTISNSIVGFAHRRLSIIDLTHAGWQPMMSHDQSCYLVFNGEIYNYLELREELQSKGYIFKSQTDSEVLLAAYQHWGKAVLQKLIGMFAFAILDLNLRTVFLARDFFGIKPLYYANVGGKVFFASEIKALLECPHVSRRANVDSIYQYLRFGMSNQSATTFFSDIHQLPPAHWLEISLDNPAVHHPVQYWSLPKNRESTMDRSQAQRTLRDLFLESVALHMRSDVPVGAALSGGIDSSAIVMAMRHIAGKKANIHTFTYAAEDDVINEERYSDIIGHSSHATMHKVRLSPNDLINDIDSLIMAQEQPFGSTSIYAQYQVFRAAKEAGIKVMLDGQGADEMLAGYKNYNPARVVSLLRQGHLIEAVKLMKRADVFENGKRIANSAKILYGIVPSILQDYLIGPLASRFYASPPWLNEGWVKAGGINDNFLPKGLQSVSELLHLTFTSTSLPALLRYEDSNSMIHSIESRVPFLTPKLAHYIFNLPEHFLIDHEGTSKSIFRQAMRELVPDAILDRRDKIGFQTPEHNWVKDLKPWILKIITSDYARSLPMLNCDHMLNEYHDIIAGKRAFDWRIWRWINLIRWSELFKVQYQ